MPSQQSYHSTSPTLDWLHGHADWKYKAYPSYDSFRSRCPVHGSKNPSTAQVKVYGKRWYAVCHSRDCPSPEILAALESQGCPSPGYQMQPRQALGRVRQWVYPPRLSDGAVFTAKRSEHAEGKGNWSMPDTKETPQGDRNRVPVLFFGDADADLVVITEGEPDAEAVQAAGFTAASYIGGSNSAHLADYSGLTGRHVVIWGDDDTPGRSAARKVATQVREIAASVRLVHEPGTESEFGASDYTSEERRRMVEEAVEFDWEEIRDAPETPVDADFPRLRLTENAVFLMLAQAGRLMQVEGAVPWIHVLTIPGDWQPLDGSEHAEAAVLNAFLHEVRSEGRILALRAEIEARDNLSIRERTRLIDEITSRVLPSDLTVRAISRKLGRLQSFADDGILRAALGDMDDYDTHPVLMRSAPPGGSISLRGDRTYTAEETAEFRLVARGWVFPETDVADVRDAILRPQYTGTIDEPAGPIIEHFYGPILWRLAYLLGPVPKKVDHIRIQGTDTGKSTLVDTLLLALPRLVDVVNGPGSFKSDRFNHELDALTQCRILFVNEADKAPGDLTNFIYEATEETVIVERKHVDARRTRNLGTAVFIGNDWAQFNAGSRAFRTRNEWAYDGLAAPKMAPWQSAKVRSPAGQAYMRAALLWRSRNISRPWESPDDRNADLHRMFAERTSPLVDVLVNLIERGDERIPNAVLTAKVTDSAPDVEIPAAAEWAAAIRTVVEDARPYRKSKERGWENIALICGSDPGQPVPEAVQGELTDRPCVDCGLREPGAVVEGKCIDEDRCIPS